MRVLFTTFPSTPHLYPVVPLAWALRSAGHEVRVACHPALAGAVTATGLTAVPMGDAVTLAATDQKIAEREQAGHSDALAVEPGRAYEWEVKWLSVVGAFQLYLPMVGDLASFAEQWRPDLVVWDPLCFPAAAVARACGAAHARFLWGQDNVGWIRARLRGGAGRPEMSWVDPLVELARPTLRRLGCDWDEELLVGQWTVDPRPAVMRLPTGLDYVAVRWVPFNGAGTVPDWLHSAATRPRVCLTLGGSHHPLPGAAGGGLPAVFDALAGLDLEVVTTLRPGQPGSPPVLPPNVRAVGYLPLDLLLPSCAAVVHHGGAGTFASAAVRGLPQLMVMTRSTWDEAVVARYVEDRGAGIALIGDDFSPAAVAGHIPRLVREPRFREGAASLRAEMMAAPSPNDVVPLLEELTARHRR